jgi:hypothetical protein
MKIIEGLLAFSALLAGPHRRYKLSKGFELCDSAWRCKQCGKLLEDVWDLKPHRLSHIS